MAFISSDSILWHEGEDLMHSKLHIPHQENPTSPFLTPYAARLLWNAPLLALGTLDDIGRPWTTLLGGEAGFARPLGQSTIGIRALVDSMYDPVIRCLLGSKDEGDWVDREPKPRPFAALSIDLATRSRVKLAGQMVAGALDKQGGDDIKEEDARATEAQMVFKVERSLGNCPKYLNKKQIIPSIPDPAMLSSTLPLPDEATALLANADLFFITSSYSEMSIGTNIRGGPSGFVRILQNDCRGTVLIYPEYSGNRLYQTLGNLAMNPKAGVVIPDFASGTVLYITGTTDVVIGKEAAALLPRSNLAVKVHVQEARLVRKALAFRGQAGEPSPYNPPIRFLATELGAGTDAQTVNDRVTYARLVKKEILTPSIGRFRFNVSDPEVAGRWKPGQYVALAFEDELGAGYSHMRDDDPLSLNDDLTRTFTVSSSLRGNLPKDEFEITIRNVGKVTNFLFRQDVRAGLEIPLKGFAGTFAVEQRDGEMIPVVAGGIGITPLLAQLPDLDLRRIKLFWSFNAKDIGLAIDTFERFPQLRGSALLYVSSEADAAARGQEVGMLEQYGAQTFQRRMVRSDVQGQQGLSATWYICAGKALRQALLSWLSDKHVIFEDFNY
ncbi:MAG: hypothetical protein Q9196_002322 [Gyalolechia fulgens]